MGKKFSLFGMAVALIALCVPAFANADSINNMTTLKPLAVGTLITGTSLNAVTTTPFGELKCKEVVLNGKITKSTTSEAEGEAVEGKEGTTTTCFKGTEAITITDVTLRNLKASAAGTTASFTFIADVPVIGTCHFEATVAPFLYDKPTPETEASKASIVFTKAALVASPSFCGPSTLDATFTLAETTAKTDVVLK